MIEPLIVDPARLKTAGAKLQSLVFPDAPARIVVGGTDAMSAAIDDTLPIIEAPVVDALPAVEAALTRTGSSIATAAGLYADTDRRLGDHIGRVQFAGADPSGPARRLTSAMAEMPDETETPDAPESPAPPGLSLPSMPQAGQVNQYGQLAGTVGYTAQSVMQSAQGATSGAPGGAAVPTQLSDSTKPEQPADEQTVAEGAAPGEQAWEGAPDQSAAQPITTPSELGV